MNKRKIH